MLKLARYLFRWTGDPKYADYYERALLNGMLGVQRMPNDYSPPAIDRCNSVDCGIYPFFPPKIWINPNILNLKNILSQHCFCIDLMWSAESDFAFARSSIMEWDSRWSLLSDAFIWLLNMNIGKDKIKMNRRTDKSGRPKNVEKLWPGILISVNECQTF